MSSVETDSVASIVFAQLPARPWEHKKPVLSEEDQRDYPRSWQVRKEVYLRWLRGIPFTHVMTVTVRIWRDDLKTTDRDIREAVVHFLKRISAECFGSRRMKAGVLVQMCAAFDWGAYRNHPHAHMAFSAPDGMCPKQFSRVLRKAKRKVKLFDRVDDFKPYRDEGWLEYMLGHGEEGFLFEVLSPICPS